MDTTPTDAVTAEWEAHTRAPTHAHTSTPAVAASSGSSAASVPPWSFRSLVPAGGLGVVLLRDYDSISLLRIAHEALQCEDQLSAGCFLIQAAALVRCWHLHTKQPPRTCEKDVITFRQTHTRIPNGLASRAGCSGRRGQVVRQRVFSPIVCPVHLSLLPCVCLRVVCTFYTGTSVLASGQPRTKSAAASSASSSVAAAAAAIPDPPRPSAPSDEICWSASFALDLYDVLDTDEFRALERWLLQTGFTSLRKLAQRFWCRANLSLMAALLRRVAEKAIGKDLLTASLAGWRRSTIMRKIKEEGQQAVMEEFDTRVENSKREREKLRIEKAAEKSRTQQQHRSDRQSVGEPSAAACVSAFPIASSSVHAAATVMSELLGVPLLWTSHPRLRSS